MSLSLKTRGAVSAPGFSFSWKNRLEELDLSRTTSFCVCLCELHLSMCVCVWVCIFAAMHFCFIPAQRTCFAAGDCGQCRRYVAGRSCFVRGRYVCGIPFPYRLIALPLALLSSMFHVNKQAGSQAGDGRARGQRNRLEGHPTCWEYLCVCVCSIIDEMIATKANKSSVIKSCEQVIEYWSRYITQKTEPWAVEGYVCKGVVHILVDVALCQRKRSCSLKLSRV